MPHISGEPAAVPICRLTGKRICPSNAAELGQTSGEPAAVTFTGIFYRECGKTDGFTDPPNPLGSSPWWFRPQQVVIRQDVTKSQGIETKSDILCLFLNKHIT